MSEVKVSYVVPAYNHERFIFDSLESIKNDGISSGFNFEIVIVDDGSSDSTKSIIENWKNENSEIKVLFSSQENRGIAYTLNKLYALTSGEYIRPCSSDDLMIEGSSKVLIESFHEEDFCVFGDGTLINDDGEYIGPSSISYHRGRVENLESKGINKALIRNWCVAGPSLMLKKAFIKSYKYDEKSRIDDFDLFLTLIASDGKIGFVNENVCKYRIHATNTSKTKDVGQRVLNLHSFLRLIDKHRSTMKIDSYRYDLACLSSLTRAKISYLEKKYIRLVFDLTSYLLYSFKARK